MLNILWSFIRRLILNRRGRDSFTLGPMTTPDNLLRRLLAITEDTPFQGTMAASTDGKESSVSGTIMFRLQAGRLRYEFFVAPETCQRDLLAN